MPDQKRLDAFAGLLNDLISHGHVAASRLSARLRHKCQPLLDAGVLKEERSGAGWVIRVINNNALEAFSEKHYPAGLFGEESLESSRRVQSIEQHRDSKAKSGLDFEFLVYRQLSGVFKIDGLEQTSRNVANGFGSAVLHDDRKAFPWPEFAGKVATVENPTVLLGFPWKKHGFDLAILTSGRSSTRMINWLDSDAMATTTITHFGDYDPVGLSEFERLYTKLGQRANLFIPENLESLFARYGNPTLLTKSAKLLQRLSKNRHPDIQKILELSRKYGGLEHEAILLLHRIGRAQSRGVECI